MYIIYKPGLDLYIMDWLSPNNHAENKDKDIAGTSMKVSAIITSVNMPVYMCIEDIQAVTHEDGYL